MAGDPRYGERASGILRRLERGEKAATSTLVMAQVFGYLKWKGKTEVIPKFLAFIRSLPNLLKLETTFHDMVQAAALCRTIGWSSWDDAVIAAQMGRLGITEIYSNDSDFDKIPNIRRIFK
jgi:predicted nucleic acid-binding protein